MAVRLAVVTDVFPRWSERYVAREVGELRRGGVEVAVFALRQGALPPGADPEWEALGEGARILPGPVSGGTALAALLAVPSLRHGERRKRLAAILRGTGPLGVVRCARSHALGRWLRQGGFTHVHAHFANWPSTIAWVAAHDASLPISFSFHARDLMLEPQLLEEKARDARALLACHAQGLERLRRVPGAGEKVRLMHHGLPLEQFPFRPLERRTNGGGGVTPPELLAAGRLVPKKGGLDLLAALQTPPLCDRRPVLTIIGDGPERGLLEREIAKRGLASQVLLRPPLPSPLFHQQFLRAALFVAPYKPAPDGDADGIPNVVLEAFALGVPVVGTDAGGLPEVLTERTGFSTPHSQPAALARSIAAALEDRAAAMERARAARALVESDFDVRRNLAVLREVVGVA